eukprot:7994298-Pyramimonas_sp.AAC.1
MFPTSGAFGVFCTPQVSCTHSRRLLQAVTGSPVRDHVDPNEGMTVRRSGLRFFDLVVGHGESPTAGDTVTIHYVASFADQGQVLTRAHYGTKDVMTPPGQCVTTTQPPPYRFGWNPMSTHGLRLVVVRCAFISLTRS